MLQNLVLRAWSFMVLIQRLIIFRLDVDCSFLYLFRLFCMINRLKIKLFRLFSSPSQPQLATFSLFTAWKSQREEVTPEIFEGSLSLHVNGNCKHVLKVRKQTQMYGAEHRPAYAFYFIVWGKYSLIPSY